MSTNILPDSRSQGGRGAVWTPNGFEVPVYCASCGAEGGHCPADSTFMFYLCQPCFEKHGEITNVFFMPDEIFFQKVAEAQVEKYGYVLDAVETEIKLGDPESLESKLARDRKWLTPNAGA